MTALFVPCCTFYVDLDSAGQKIMPSPLFHLCVDRKEWAAISRGAFPWNRRDFLEVSGWLVEQRRAHPAGHDGLAVDIDEVAAYMLAEFGEDVYRPQVYRFWTISQFLRTHSRKLQRHDLTCESTTSDVELSEELSEALCILPFTKIIENGPDPVYTFDYDQVVRKALDIRARARSTQGPT